MAAIDKPPRFFSLIPSCYYEHLPRRLPKSAILMETGGKFWKVAMVSKRGQVFFGQGWSSFVADNKLQDGEYLTFIYDGQHSFLVSVYNRGGDRETRATVQVEELSDDESESDNNNNNSDHHSHDNHDITDIHVEEISDDDDTESDSDNNNNSDHHSHGNHDIPDIHVEEISTDDDTDSDSDKDFSPDGNDTESDGDNEYTPRLRATATIPVNAHVASTSRTKRTSGRDMYTIENRAAYLDDPNNLSFETYLKGTNFGLLVRRKLVIDYCLKFGSGIEFIDGHGKLDAKLASWKDGRVWINGWQRICRRNKVKKNDTMLCEVFRNGDNLVYAIKVHVVRGAAAGLF